MRHILNIYRSLIKFVYSKLLSVKDKTNAKRNQIQTIFHWLNKHKWPLISLIPILGLAWPPTSWRLNSKRTKICIGGFTSFSLFFPLVQQQDKDVDPDWKYIHTHSVEIFIWPDPTSGQSLKLRRCMSVSLHPSDNCRVSAELSRFCTVLRERSQLTDRPELALIHLPWSTDKTSSSLSARVHKSKCTAEQPKRGREWLRLEAHPASYTFTA